MPTRQKKSLPPKLPTPRAVTTVRVKPAENFAIFDSTDRPQLLCRREDDQSILICFNYAGPHHKDLSRSKLESEANRRIFRTREPLAIPFFLGETTPIPPSALRRGKGGPLQRPRRVKRLRRKR